jgi:hypothetical protein
MRGTRAKEIRKRATLFWGVANKQYRNCPPSKTIYMRLKKMHTGRMPTDRSLLYRPVKRIKRYRIDWDGLKDQLAEFWANVKQSKEKRA